MDNEIFIGNVKLDFSAYDGKDSYSDGDIENEILFHVKSGNEEEFLRKDNRWPVIYYLSPLRHFLLEWLPIGKNDSVLEIGCGCGALTSCLLSKGATVEGVELSPRRAQICAIRNRHEKNLTIHVGNLNDVTFDKKFDFVLLVGVLEYAPRFTHTKNPQADFINKCKSFLKPGGALVIAIENRFGIEYFAGKPEDHTGKLFDGIMDYPNPNGIKTLSRFELKQLLNSCGLPEQKFFYPYPDYKFPYFMHSDEMLPTASEFAHFNDIFYDMNKAELFSMNHAMPSIINAGLYPDLANAFLVVASQNNEAQRIFPLKIISNNCPRKPKYQLLTEIYRDSSTGDRIVKKVARNPLAREHLKTLVENCKIFSETYGAEHVAQMKLVSDDTAEVEYIEGMTFEDHIIRALKAGGSEEFFNLLIFYLQNLVRGTADDNKFSDDLVEFNSPNRKYEYDLNLHNILIRNNDFVIFDYEFLLPILPQKFVAWRAFRDICFKRADFLKQYGITFENLVATLKLSPDTLKSYEIQNRVIFNAIVDTHNENYKKKRIPVKEFKFE